MDFDRGPREFHHWTLQHKILLCVLSRYLKSAGSLDSSSKLCPGCDRILSHIFAHDLSQATTVPAVSLQAIQSMLYELHRKRHKSWMAVFIITDFRDTNGKWRREMELLKSTAERLGIRLVRRRAEHPVALRQIRECKPSTARSARQQEQRQTPSPVGKQLSNLVRQQRDLIPDEEEPRVVVSKPRIAERTQTKSSVAPGLMSMTEYHALLLQQALNDPVWDSYSYENQLRGRLFFRVISPDSKSINTSEGDFAGLWTGGRMPNIPRSSIEFMLAAFVHLRPLPDATPFLSLSSSIVWALVMFFRRPDTALQIIDMDAMLRYNKSPSYLTPVKRLVEHQPAFNACLAQINNQTGTSAPVAGVRPYSSAHDWLVWGEIPGEAILTHYKRSDMESFLRANPEIDRRLHLTDMGQCQYTRNASTLLREAAIETTGMFGKAVGGFAYALGLDAAAALKLSERIKYHWSDKYPKLTPAGRPRRTKIVAGCNLIYAGGVFRGYCSAMVAQRQAAMESLATSNLRDVDLDRASLTAHINLGDGHDALLDSPGNEPTSDDLCELMELVDFGPESDEEMSSSSDDDVDIFDIHNSQEMDRSGEAWCFVGDPDHHISGSSQLGNSVQHNDWNQPGARVAQAHTSRSDEVMPHGVGGYWVQESGSWVQHWHPSS